MRARELFYKVIHPVVFLIKSLKLLVVKGSQITFSFAFGALFYSVFLAVIAPLFGFLLGFDAVKRRGRA